MCWLIKYLLFFFFNDTATTEIYTLSLHDALPISGRGRADRSPGPGRRYAPRPAVRTGCRVPRRPSRGPARRPGHVSSSDRKSTRLNSSHANISYAVFCLKKKKKNHKLLLHVDLLT